VIENLQLFYGACPKTETSRFFFFLGPLAFCRGPIM